MTCREQIDLKLYFYIYTVCVLHKLLYFYGTESARSSAG